MPIMRESERRTFLEPRRKRADLPWDYWIDGQVWSVVFAFLVILLLLLMVTSPFPSQVKGVLDRSSTGGALFLVIYLLVFGIAAITLGQAETMWRDRLSWRGSLLHLGARIALALLLSLPFWLVLFALLGAEGLRLPALLAHLWLFGMVLALFGWWLGLSGASELVQFNVKYLAFFGFLFGSLFLPGLRLLNPFALTEFVLWGPEAAEGAPWAGELLWLGLGLLLAAATRRRWRRFSLEWEGLWKHST